MITQQRNLMAGFWNLAAPRITLASMTSIFLGASMAVRDGSRDWAWLALIVGGIFALEWAKNASDEVFDYVSGTDLAVAPEDRSPFSGGKRVLVDGLLSVRETWAISILGYLLCILAGAAIVLWREPAVLWLGIAGVALAFFYEAPPFKLAYRGWGEAAVFAAYGPLISAGTYLTLTHAVSPALIALSLPLGLLIAAFLWINEFPDYRADAGAGKRTLVVRFGRPRAARIFAGLLVAALALLLGAVALGAPVGALGGLIAVVPATLAARTLLAHPEDTQRIVPAQVQTLAAFVTYALGAGLGLMLF